LSQDGNIHEAAGSSAPEFSFQNHLTTGLRVPVVSLAGYLDLRVFPGIALLTSVPVLVSIQLLAQLELRD
jgi:hypothetical protein